MSAKEQFAEVIANVPESASLEEVFARLYRAFKEKMRHQAQARSAISLPDIDEELSPELEEAIASLSLLDDEALWRAARSRVPEDAVAALEHLNRKRQAEGLSSSEAERQAALVRHHERTLLIRAEAAALLRERGHDVSTLVPAS
ncbi:MAG TPA: hypothetical protein VK459_21505 [Polyangiaceae bacterium]|nr:hypothetical protein [Polyangiaceae bacterium]